MTDKEKMADEAAKLFLDRFHWSQAILGACAKLFREEPPSDDLIAALSPFGGGMASSGQICGILPGALAVIGFTLGKTKSQDKDHKLMWKISQQMVSKFAEITRPYGGSNCFDIARVNWKDREAVKQFYIDPDSNRKNCVKVIRETSDYLHTLITDNFPEKD